MATKPAQKKSAPKKTAPSKSSAAKSSSANGKVAAKSDAAAGLNDLFEDMLKDIYWAEKALTKALPKMAKNATSPELVSCLQEHLQVTHGQIARLEQVFENIGKPAKAVKCEAMDGLIKEAQDIMESTEDGVVRDAGIIAAGQKVEHYEIATYGTLVAFAKILGEDDSVELLHASLEEEKEADETLTTLAETAVNIAAAEEDEDSADDDDSQTDDDEMPAKKAAPKKSGSKKK